MSGLFNACSIGAGAVPNRYFMSITATWFPEDADEAPTADLAFPANSFIESMQGTLCYTASDSGQFLLQFVAMSTPNLDRLSINRKVWGPNEDTGTSGGVHQKAAINETFRYHDLKLWTGTTGIVTVTLYWTAIPLIVNPAHGLDINARVGLSRIGTAKANRLSRSTEGN